DRRGSRVVRGDDVDLAGRGVDRGLQVVGRQLRIEIVQGRNLTGAQTEGDAGRRAATRRGNGQRLARETVTDRSEAELGQRRTGQGQAGSAARNGDRAARDRRRDAGRGVDRRKQVSDVVADADAGARARGAGNEGEGGAVDDQRVGGGDRGGEVVGRRRAGTGQDRRGGDRGGGAGVVVVDDGAGRRGGRVQEVARGRAGESSRGHVRLRRIAGRGLQHLVGDRLGAGDQALQRGKAGVGGLQHLHAVADAIEQVADVAGAVVQRLRSEEVGRVVEGRVDLVAGGEVILGLREQRSSRLQREQVLADRGRENNTGHK